MLMAAPAEAEDRRDHAHPHQQTHVADDAGGERVVIDIIASMSRRKS
ncbi:MAG TPA: hypothetical protein VFY40_13320 [Blastocatellia bacterium]|nr:hypothetical protein [Blastocatellia bacterium]